MAPTRASIHTRTSLKIPTLHCTLHPYRHAANYSVRADISSQQQVTLTVYNLPPLV